MLASVSLAGVGLHSESWVGVVVLRRLPSDEVNPVRVSVMCACRQKKKGGGGIYELQYYFIYRTAEIFTDKIFHQTKISLNPPTLALKKYTVE